MKKYPLKLEAYKKGVVWGGTTLKKKYSKDFPTDDLGETWELSIRENENCVILNGEYSGMTLGEYLGGIKNFPLLVKLIDANDALSIQVHPEKYELWYVVEAEPGAQVVYGLKRNMSAEEILAAAKDGRLEDDLQYVSVKAGDTLFIPDGLIHSICGGVVIAEVQENNDTTYRLYDYNRRGADGKPRELHIEKAVEVFKNLTNAEIRAQRYSLGKKGENNLANCSYFTVDKYELTKSSSFTNEYYTHILCIDGEGSINGEAVKKGDSYFIPKGLLEYTVEPCGRITIIASGFPDTKKQ